MVVSIEKGMYPSIDPKMPESFLPNGQGLGILLFGASLDEKDVPPVPTICQKVGHSKQVDTTECISQYELVYRNGFTQTDSNGSRAETPKEIQTRGFQTKVTCLLRTSMGDRDALPVPDSTERSFRRKNLAISGS